MFRINYFFDWSCYVMCVFQWVSPKALPWLRCFCKYCFPIDPHMPSNPKWWKQPPCSPKNERNSRKNPLGKWGAIVKMFNEESCSLIYYNNKMYENVVHGVPAVSQQPPKSSLYFKTVQIQEWLIPVVILFLSINHKNGTTNTHK